MCKTVSGDTWDLIAYKVYGSEKFVPQLLAANPDFVRVFVFEAGVELTIPVVESVKVQDVLPWRA